MSEETFTTNIGGCDPSDCASCTSDCAGAGQAIPRVPNPTIKLTLEDDSVLECAVLTTFDVEGFGEYIALIPLDKTAKIRVERLSFSVIMKKTEILLSITLNVKMNTWLLLKASKTLSKIFLTKMK